MSYPEVIKYLESFINYEKIPHWPYKQSLKLERIKEFLKSIDNPQNSLKCIHIAGTKGKGSTCAFVAYILREAGFKVGLYTSPHLSDFRERIRILNRRACCSVVPVVASKDFEGMISQDELTDLVERFRLAIDKYEQDSIYGPLPFFEIYTSLTFVYFKQKKVDFAVLETGLGGRLDATNVIEPLVCAITPISYEHTEKLGRTLREIAAEKAGIIKEQRAIVLSALQEKEAQEVIRSRCKEIGAKLYEVGKDITYQKTKAGFKVKGIFGEYPNLKIKLIGEHQLINATVAVGVIEALGQHGINIGIEAIKDGLYNTLWPGRCEIVAQEPWIVLDGAQNVASAHALKKAIKENFQYKRLILVLGISCDKDIKGICLELSELTDEVILTRANNPRASSPDSLAKYFNGKVVHRTNDIQEAKKKAKDIAGKEDLVLVTGSLFVVGEFRDESLQSKPYHCRNFYAHR